MLVDARRLTADWASSASKLGHDTYDQWRQDRTIRLGAGLAFYAIFAIVPLLAVTVAVGARLLDRQDLEEYLADELADTAGIDAETVATAVTGELATGFSGPSLGIIGFAALVFTSSVAFVALVDAIDTIWHVPVRSGLRASVRRRLLSFGLVLLTGGVVLGSFVVSSLTSAARAAIPGTSRYFGWTAEAVDGFASWLLLAGALAVLLRVVSPQPLPWRVSLVVGLITSLLLTAGTWLFGWYLQTWGSPSVSGTFGAALLTLTWIYYEVQILLVGVQLSKVLVSNSFTRVNPSPHIDDEAGNRTG